MPVTAEMLVSNSSVALPLVLSPGSFSLCYFMPSTGWHSVQLANTSGAASGALVLGPALGTSEAMTHMAFEPMALQSFGYILADADRYAVAEVACTGNLSYVPVNKPIMLDPGQYQVCHQAASGAVQWMAQITAKGLLQFM